MIHHFVTHLLHGQKQRARADAAAAALPCAEMARAPDGRSAGDAQADRERERDTDGAARES